MSLWGVAIVGIAALVALSFFVWQRLGQSTGSDAPALSLAVLPFDAAVPEEKAVAEAMGREVATGLARGPPLQVASYNASATYRGAGQSSTAIAGALGVRYTLEAELRRENRMLTVDFRLLEGHSGATVATRRIETRDDQPATQQLAALRATAAVSRTLVRHERSRIVNRPLRNPSAIELALQADGMQIGNDGNADLPAKVIQLYDEAIRRDPGLAYPLYRKADVLSNVTQFPGPDRTQGVLELDRITLHAIRLAPQDARAWDTRAEALRQQQRWDAALEASATALRLDPSNPSLMHQRAFALMWVGRSAEALPFSIRAIEIASEDDDIAEYRRLLCRAHLVLGRYDDAINERACSEPCQFLAYSRIPNCGLCSEGGYGASARSQRATSACPPWVHHQLDRRLCRPSTSNMAGAIQDARNRWFAEGGCA